MGRDRKRSNRREVHALEYAASLILFQLGLAFSKKLGEQFMPSDGFSVETISKAQWEQEGGVWSFEIAKVIRIRPRRWDKKEYVELILEWCESGPPQPRRGVVEHHRLPEGGVLFLYEHGLVGASPRWHSHELEKLNAVLSSRLAF